MKIIFQKYFFYLCLAFLFTTQHLISQIDTSSVADDDETINSIVDNGAEEENNQYLIEDLEFYREHPINLSTAGYAELIALPFISPNIAVKILLLRDTVEIISFDQLRAIPELSEDLVKKISMFAVLERGIALRAFKEFAPHKFQFRSRLEKRVQELKGFQTQKFLGNRNYLYQRMKIFSSHYEIGVLSEKDAGERTGDGFVIGSVSIKDFGALRQFNIGTYSLSFGEALAVGKNLAAARGFDAVGQIKKRGSMLRPSLSTDEFRYFQGVAAELQHENISFIPYYSNRNLTGAFDSAAKSVSSFYTSGLFRTEKDLLRRNTTAEKFYGSAVIFSSEERNSIGINYSNVKYDHFLKPALLDFENKKNRQIINSWGALNFSWLSVFGEAATNDANRFSKILGAAMNLSKILSFAFHHRNYTQGFVSPFSNPISIRSKISDGETGNYFGIEVKPERNIFLSGYLDVYSLHGKNEFGAKGTEELLYSKISLTRKFSIELQLKVRNKSQIEIRELDDERIQKNFRFAYKYKPANFLSFSQRFEVVRVNYKPSNYSEQGFLTFAEILSRHPSQSYFFKARLAMFNTTSYDSRLYQYESDVAGNYSNPPMYGKGARWYLVTGYEVFDKFLFSLKYSETIRYGIDGIGSGDDEIKGNLDNQLAVQIDFTF